MSDYQILTESDFDSRYTMNKTLKSQHFRDSPGQFETFDKDLEIVLAHDPRYVWTCVDGDDGMYYVAGYHLVNRVYYLITNEPWQSEDEEYLIDAYDQNDEVDILPFLKKGDSF